MRYITGAGTDIGSVRETNQDAVCIMEAQTPLGKVCMVIVCDGMGGLSKGEVASATVIRSFERWFEEKMPLLMGECSMGELRAIWMDELCTLSNRIKAYGMEKHILLGTTFSGMLFIEDKYIWAHVGDSRIYQIQDDNIVQITEDHTVIARELALGNMTEEEAKRSKLRNKLTQCIGASKVFEPQSGSGVIKNGESFLLCSDGFYHRYQKDEMMQISRARYTTEGDLDRACVEAIRKTIERGEKDNVSVAVIKFD